MIEGVLFHRARGDVLAAAGWPVGLRQYRNGYDARFNERL